MRPIPYLDDDKSVRKENHHTPELSHLHYINSEHKISVVPPATTYEYIIPS